MIKTLCKALINHRERGICLNCHICHQSWIRVPTAKKQEQQPGNSTNADRPKSFQCGLCMLINFWAFRRLNNSFYLTQIYVLVSQIITEVLLIFLLEAPCCFASVPLVSNLSLLLKTFGLDHQSSNHNGEEKNLTWLPSLKLSPKSISLKHSFSALHRMFRGLRSAWT